MDYKSTKGFTLIELIITILIIGVLSFVGAHMMSFLIQGSVFIPSQLNMDMLASDALEIMIEGDDQARGLRFCRSISTVLPNEIIFRNENNQTIRFRLVGSAPTIRLVRSINGGVEQSVPYYSPLGVTVSGTSNQIFTYYDANETVTNNPANVRWIAISLGAQMGSGTFANWQGRSSFSTSVAVFRFP